MRRALPCSLVLLLACGPFFYQAPPPLASYPERLATKRWAHIFEEVAPPDPSLPGVEAMDQEIAKLPETLAPLGPAKRLAEIDRLLAQNRGGQYSVRRANFLIELRELAAEPAHFNAARTYIEWRAKHDTVVPKAPPAEKPWDMEEKDFAEAAQLFDFQLKQRLTFFKEQLEKADPFMKPYWLTRRAAFQFGNQRYAEAIADFNTVMEDFPDHPRAEVAELMLARCALERSRQLKSGEEADQNPEEALALLEEAQDKLEAFIEGRPKSRFLPDAHGWLGAVAFDRGLLGTAMSCQARRLELQPTREIRRTVLKECDLIFEALLKSFDEGRFHETYIAPDEKFNAAAVARHPEIARLFVQHCIDPAADISLPTWWDDSESGGRGTIDFLKRRILNPKPFVRLALDELGRELVKAGKAGDSVTTTLLAWSATENGEHEQALALLDLLEGKAANDEALLARGVVLERLGRPADAIRAYETLGKSFPGSPLVNDLRYRKSLCLHQVGKPGEAIEEILPLVFAPPVAVGENGDAEKINLYLPSQSIQWLDFLIQFAPLDQLETAYESTGDDSKAKPWLNDAIRTRALAVENFDLASRHLTKEGEIPEPKDDYIDTRTLADFLPMTKGDWEKRVSSLAALSGRLSNNPPESERAKLHLEIARQWMDQRGRLSMPSVSICYFAASEEEKQEQLRRRNALALGMPAEAVHRELDSRDEATHALAHALEAAKSGDPAIAAPALELANQCLFRRAEFSLYQQSRALETHASDLSADIHKQLTGRFPNTPEAARAVFFTFKPMAGSWMPGDYNEWNAAGALTAAMFGFDEENRPGDQDTDEKIDQVVNLAEQIDPAKPLAKVRKELDAARADLDLLRVKTDPDAQWNVVAAIDRIDDLRAAASLPGIKTVDLRNYAEGIKNGLPAGFASLLDFRDRLVVLTDAEGNETGYKNDTIQGWREFLERWPNSPKAEAASFRLTRLIARQTRGRKTISAFHFPDAPIPNGYKHLKVERPNGNTDPAETLAAIREHESRFPMGRYQDDINLLRAGALIDSGEFAKALAILESLLGNPVQTDLHTLASLEFADIAQRLLDPETRGPVAKAFRANSVAMKHLGQLVRGDTFLWRLTPLMPWLER